MTSHLQAKLSTFQLQQGEIFVFPTDLAGAHLNPLARRALKLGAVYGQCRGLHGATYAIPTRDCTLVPFESIRVINEVQKFFTFASGLPTIRFYLSDLALNHTGPDLSQIQEWIAAVQKPCNVRLLELINA